MVSLGAGGGDSFGGGDEVVNLVLTFFDDKESYKEITALARAGANSFRGLAKAPNSLRESNAELLDVRPLEFAYAHSLCAEFFFKN